MTNLYAHVIALGITLGALGACEWNSASPKVDAQSGPRTDGRPRPDADEDIDADPDADMPADGTLLLSEIALQPVGGEFIEIMNPTTSTISLANYYLSDSGDYWRLPGGVPTIGVSDFLVEFPATASIPAGGAITVAIGTAAAFTTTYGAAPTYSITDGTVTRTSVPGAPTLTDTGEIVVLFHWDAANVNSLVADVDIMLAGIPSSNNGIVSKSGMTVAGMTYATDANTLLPQTASPGNGVSTKRVMAETGRETQDGTGNGISGDDETSEQNRTTWDTTFSAPTPGTAPSL